MRANSLRDPPPGLGGLSKDNAGLSHALGFMKAFEPTKEVDLRVITSSMRAKEACAFCRTAYFSCCLERVQTLSQGHQQKGA